MSDLKQMDSSRHQENPRNTHLYAPEILIYPIENRLDINLIRKRNIENMKNGWYKPGQKGSVYFFLSRIPIPEEVSQMITERNVDTSNATVIEKVYARIPAQLSYRLTIKSSDSNIVKYGSSYLYIYFDKDNGASVQTDLVPDERDFVLAELDESLEIFLSEAKSGKEPSRIPPGITHDPIGVTMTDEAFEAEMRNSGSFEKITKQRTQTIAEMKWLQMTVKEIRSKILVTKNHLS